MKLVFATGNAHKVSEVARLLPPSVELVSLHDIGFGEELPETSPTIASNSRQKAVYLYNKLGVDCFAEDTGLEVAALNGEPGIYSARYAGPGKDANDNMDLLLARMAGKEDRRARFVTVITLLVQGEEFQFEGELQGTIGTARRGSHGFGYDPVFVLPDGRTLAELDPAEKSAVSHRARATAKLVEFLKKRYI